MQPRHWKAKKARRLFIQLQDASTPVECEKTYGTKLIQFLITSKSLVQLLSRLFELHLLSGKFRSMAANLLYQPVRPVCGTSGRICRREVFRLRAHLFHDFLGCRRASRSKK